MYVNVRKYNSQPLLSTLIRQPFELLFSNPTDPYPIQYLPSMLMLKIDKPDDAVPYPNPPGSSRIVR
jgi:hypothetical protein